MRRLGPFLLFGACAASPDGEAGKEAGSEPPPLVAPVPKGSIHRTARDTDFASMAAELARADVVYVGEKHDDPKHHEIQARIVEELWSRGRLHAVGMEMFQRRFQKHLDDYVEGRTGEAEMLERTGWKERWGFDFALYRPILEFARSKRLPVVALNVEDEVRVKMREGGIDAVPEEARRTLPAPYTEDREHREFVFESYRAHLKEGEEPDPAKFELFYAGMCLWDDVMADSVVRWFAAAPKDAQIVVLAGGGHLANRYGIPGRAFRRNGKPYSIVMPVSGDPDDADFARRFADFVWVTG
jgi:uncharacterized iron-regulated protein